MKKLSLYIFLVLMWCNVGVAKPVLLECKEDNYLDPNEDSYDYFSLDLEKKDFNHVASKIVLKSNCSLGNCDQVTKHNNKLPFIREDAEILSIGKDEQYNAHMFSFNKSNLSLTWYFSYFEEMTNGTFKNVERHVYSSCKTINKFPFK